MRPFTDKQIALSAEFRRAGGDRDGERAADHRDARGLEQQTATAEVLQVINSSPGDLAPVFDAMLEKAHSAVRRGPSAALNSATASSSAPWPCAVARAHSPTACEQGFRARTQRTRCRHWSRRAHSSTSPIWRRLTDQQTSRDRRCSNSAAPAPCLIVALRKDDALARPDRRRPPGSAAVLRQADRAAAEFRRAGGDRDGERAAHHRDARGLEQQTATAEVLQVINSSPGDLAPVFDAMLEKALRLCDAAFGIVDDAMRASASARCRMLGVPTAFANCMRAVQCEFGPGTGPARCWKASRWSTSPIWQRWSAYRAGEPHATRSRRSRRRAHSPVVALRKDDALLGLICDLSPGGAAVHRQADRAVAELRRASGHRDGECAADHRDARGFGTADRDRRGIAGHQFSPGDLAPVFDAMLEKAMRLCEARFGPTRAFTTASASDSSLRTACRGLCRGSAGAGAAVGRLGNQLAAIAGRRARRPHRRCRGDRELYRAGPMTRRAGRALAASARLLRVALRKDDDACSAPDHVYRQEVRPFSDKQIALLQNFAAQAVIAMENARLITETREALEQQTATAEVLGVINSSPGDLAPVFDAMLEKAMRLCEAAFGILLTYDGERFHAVAHARRAAAFCRVSAAACIQPARHRRLRRHLARRARSSTSPIGSDGGLSDEPRCARRLVELGGVRTGIIVALRKDDDLLGHHHRLSPGSPAVLRQADRAAAEFRRAGGHRDGECAADHRDARGLGAADRDRRGAAGHQFARPATSRRCSTRCWKRRMRLCEAAHGIVLDLRRRALPIRSRSAACPRIRRILRQSRAASASRRQRSLSG